MIRRVLVLDRGAYASRVFSTCRAIGIETVAVFTDENASYVKEANIAVRLPGHWPGFDGTHGVDVHDIVMTADRCGADAIHPGQGLFARNPHLATAVTDAGLTWIGASPRICSVMNSKLDAKNLLAQAGQRVLPARVAIDDVTDFPVVVKPNAGWGGRGMRVVHDPESLVEAIAYTRREAALSFGDGTVYCEQFLEPVRHIEVQIISDESGTVVPLGERECSIQRHRQTVMEEAPSPAVDPGLRAELFTASTNAIKAIGHVGVATVEFLLSAEGEFHILKISICLEAGHPVTECVFGIDLVRLQFLVAEGGTLPFSTPPPMRGHAIAVRLAAEDPAYDWRPSEGKIRRFTIPGVSHHRGPLLIPGIRLDSAISDNSIVRLGQDPTIGRITAWAPTRHEAARMLSCALTHTRVHGVSTNRDLLVRVLRHPAFLAGDINTTFLDQRPEVFVPLLSSLDSVRLSCLAAALAGSACRRAAAQCLASLPPGWRNVPSPLQKIVYAGPTGTLEVSYQFNRFGSLSDWSVHDIDRTLSPGTPARQGTLSPHSVVVIDVSPCRVILEVSGIRLFFDVHIVSDNQDDPHLEELSIFYVDSSEGSVTFTELSRFPFPAAHAGILD